MDDTVKQEAEPHLRSETATFDYAKIWRALHDSVDKGIRPTDGKYLDESKVETVFERMVEWEEHACDKDCPRPCPVVELREELQYIMAATVGVLQVRGIMIADLHTGHYDEPHNQDQVADLDRLGTLAVQAMRAIKEWTANLLLDIASIRAAVQGKLDEDQKVSAAEERAKETMEWIKEVESK